MFKVGDKYRIVDAEDSQLNEWHGDGDIVEVISVKNILGENVGFVGENNGQWIDNNDIENGFVVKTTSVGELHMDVTLDTTTTTDVREILCRAAEQIHDKTGIRIEEIDFHWTDVGDGPYIHSIHIEGGA